MTRAHAGPATPVIECADVTRSFQVRQRRILGSARAVHAVDSVSLSIARQEVFAIVGESGAGKTTLMKMLLGLLPPTSGTIRLGGSPLDRIARADIARRVQPVFQDPYSSLNPRKTLRQIISLPLVVHGIGTEGSRRARVRELLDMVGLASPLIHAYPSQLSGGQRQRVAIARALAIEPEMLVCDEPTSALDVSVQAQIINLLGDLQRGLGLTYVIVSHNLGLVEHMADRVAVMYLGRIVELGDTGQIFGQPRHPYTRMLLDAVLTTEPALGLPAGPLGDTFADPLNPPDGCSFHPRCAEALGVCGSQPPAEALFATGRVECHLYSGGGEVKDG